MSKEQRKRIDIVKVKLVKESSILYEQRRINSPSVASNLMETFLDGLDREELIVLSLDTKNQPTTINVCSRGSINSSIVHPREVFKTAILSNAASIIIGHNHPSGDTTPSNEDLSITKRLIDAGKILGINLIDHIIIGSDGDYTSLKERGDI